MTINNTATATHKFGSAGGEVTGSATAPDGNRDNHLPGDSPTSNETCVPESPETHSGDESLVMKKAQVPDTDATWAASSVATECGPSSTEPRFTAEKYRRVKRGYAFKELRSLCC